MRSFIGALLALLALTLAGYFFFPGHTYLQSDTQIYVPILERLNDPTLFAQEIIAQQPHVSFTIYDEASIGLRRLTSLGFRDVLAFQQIVARLAALIGVFLLARSFFPTSFAAPLLIAAIFGLGATIQGPSVLTFEYEPNPRGNALGFTFLATGLLAQRRYLLSGAAAGLALLYHVPAVYPYWIACFLITLLPQRRPRIQLWIPMLSSFALLLVFAHFQTGEGDRQSFFSTIDQAHESMMRERASYNWVSLWPARNYWHYLIMLSIAGTALYRLRHRMARELQVFIGALIVVGMISMPVSYLLLEHLKWSLVPQIQPMRAVLYVTAFTVILCASAAVSAAQNKRWLECFAFFFLSLAPPSSIKTIQYIWESDSLRNTSAAFAGAALLVAVSLLASRTKHGWILTTTAALSLTFFIPSISRVRNYPPLHHAELDDLSRWARQNTPKDAIFLFPDAGKDLYVGVFRAEALRTVYVDWKGGGQINFIREFLTVWQPRWQALMVPKFEPANIDRYTPFGIHYIVLQSKNKLPNQSPIYSNKLYQVYPLH